MKTIYWIDVNVQSTQIATDWVWWVTELWISTIKSFKLSFEKIWNFANQLNRGICPYSGFFWYQLQRWKGWIRQVLELRYRLRTFTLTLWLEYRNAEVGVVKHFPVLQIRPEFYVFANFCSLRDAYNSFLSSSLQLFCSGNIQFPGNECSCHKSTTALTVIIYSLSDTLSCRTSYGKAEDNTLTYYVRQVNCTWIPYRIMQCPFYIGQTQIKVLTSFAIFLSSISGF